MVFYRRDYSITKDCHHNTYDSCIIEITERCNIQHCVFKNCIFIYGAYNVNFIDCIFSNNVYPDECNFDEIVKDVYKKVYSLKNENALVAKLLIPSTSKRVSGASNKCRAEYARVLELYCNGKVSRAKTAKSRYNKSFRYKVGEIVRPTEEFDTSMKVCSTGIHFFLTFKEAQDYF